MGYIKGQNRGQITLFPDAIDDYIQDNSSVRIIDEYIEQLDIEKLGFKRAVPSTTGRPPYNPKDLLKLYIYGYLNRIRSSRRLEQETMRNIEVMWLLKNLPLTLKPLQTLEKTTKKH